jgi:hypothetical protein
MHNSPLVILLALLSFSTALPAADPGPAEVVVAFNRAITERKLDAALAHFASGSVQYTLRAAHAGVPTAAGIASDLKTHWSTIGPVLLGATESYQRVPEILATRVDGDLATVWARITSESIERSGNRKQGQFSEVYLLVHTASGWQIGSMADNRGTSSLARQPAATASPE